MSASRTLSVMVTLAAVLGACGGSDADSDAETAAEPDDATEPEEVTATEVEEVAESEETPEAEASEGGAGMAVLTVDDGTVYEFEMTSCDTSNNTDIFLIDPGYDLFGRNDDGFSFGLIRAAFEEPASALGDLEGGFDDNGVNPSMSYVIREPESVITLDGNTITGDLVLDGFISSEKTHGDEATATLTVTC